MGLWGKSTTAESRPKFLPIDSNAQGSGGSRQDAIATSGGWALSPGHANSGNDNKDAQPEVLVCIRNLADVFGSATPISIGFTEGEVADTGTFDITITFDEAVDVTSAAWTANQTVTNKAHILLSRLGASDMVEDSTVACQYFSGSGTNQITFRGVVQTNAAAGFLAFNGAGVGDTAPEAQAAIVFNGTADIAEEDGGSILGLMLEEGARDVPGDKVVLDGTDGTSANAGDFIVQDTSADENDSLVLEENTDFGTDILTSEGITPPENIFRKNENTLRVNHTISHNENSMAAGPLTVESGVTLTIEGNLTIV